MKTYNDEVLLCLVAVIRGDEKMQQQLAKNGYRELSEFWDAYRDVEPSFKWLLQNGHPHLAALADGFGGDDKAKIFLLKNGCPELAAVIDAVDENETALAWLLKSGNKGWALVARELFRHKWKNNPGRFSKAIRKFW